MRQFGLPRRDSRHGHILRLQLSLCMDSVPTNGNSPKEIRIPFRFELQGSDADGVEHSAETESLSEVSLVMRSPIPLRVGALLRIRIRLPIAIGGSLAKVVSIAGRVVRELELLEGRRRYEVALMSASAD